MPTRGSDRADAVGVIDQELPSLFAAVDDGAVAVPDEVAELASIRSRHLSSYYHIWANVCIRATARRPRTTALGPNRSREPASADFRVRSEAGSSVYVTAHPAVRQPIR